jgi:hypothetical protein
MKRDVDRFFPRNGSCMFHHTRYARHRLIDAIKCRYRAGESVAFLARDIWLSRTAIKAAINSSPDDNRMTPREICISARIRYEDEQMPFPKPNREPKPRKRMKRSRLRPVGKVGKRRIALSRELTAKAKEEGYDSCEIKDVLRDMGIDDSPCHGEITNAHSMKTTARRTFAGAERERLERETVRSCTRHHYYVTDVQKPEVQRAIVRESIARRKEQ